MQTGRSTIRRRATPPAASRDRERAKVELLVLHDDPRPAAELLKSYTAKSARRAPHYHVGAKGAITRLVSEQRAARFTGKAEWKKRRRDIDRIAISIVLEHTPGAPYSWDLLSAAQVLVDRLSEKYKLSASALYSWAADPSLPEEGVLVEATLPPDPTWFPWDEDGPPIEPPTYELPFDAAGPLVLGAEPASTPQDLWNALEQETFRLRGGGYHGEWAFHQRADAQGLGAPLAPNQGTADKQYNYQVFARDTLYNVGQQWSNVQSLAGGLAGAIPAGGPARQLLEASYAASGATLFPNQAFAQLAVREGLGPALGNSYRQQIAGQMYVLQVFALDTLYTPLANPESATKWGDVRRLSQTPAGDLANGLWAESYKPSRATFDANSRFQQQAAAQHLGAPLSGVYQLPVGDAKYDIQVFALDTLYAGADGAVQSKNALPHTATSAPAPAPTPAPPATIVPPSSGAKAGILPSSGLESVWLQQHPNAPDKVKNLIVQALCLLGPEDTIFDALPPNLRNMTYGATGKSPKDICCADYVSLSLAAAGLDYHWRDLEGTASTMRARYYQPCPSNAAKLRELGDGEAWLPGDILTYYSGSNPAYHVNMFIGPISGSLLQVNNDGSRSPATYKAGDGNEIVEGSINDRGGEIRINKNNKPARLAYWRGQPHRRVRLRELEDAYRQAGML